MTREICLLFDTTGLNAFTEAILQEYREAISDLCDVYAVVHHHGDVRCTDRDSRVIYLTDSQIFDEVDHHKDTSRGLIPGNPDLKMVRVMREVPNYRQYIWIEYDVFCTGNLRSALTSLMAVTRNADFAASYILPWKQDGWMWWNSLKVPAHLGREPSAIAVRAFLPLLVFSKRYIDVFEEQLKLGWAGHFEVTMATIASVCGLQMLDLSKSEPRFTHYPQFKIKQVAKLEEFVPIFVHPVKTSDARAEIRKKLAELQCTAMA
ncbi:hypothetical protein [Bradyrhizobium sp. USDA 10063]